MAPLLKWTEPRAVAKWEFKNQGLPEFKKLFLLFWKWSLLVGVPVLLGTWIWLPQSFLQVLSRLLVCCSLVPAMIVFQVWIFNWGGVGCVIDHKGITRSFGDKAHRYLWKQIESFEVMDYPHVPGIRMLVIRVRKGKQQFERQFRFSPQEINEKELLELLRQHIPLSPWQQAVGAAHQT